MSPLATRIVEMLRERPRHFAEIAEAHMEVPWREFLQAWAEVRGSAMVGRHEYGLYTIKDSQEDRR
ncbi:MAG TPA: hypothetical protein VGT02_14265 [Methylomirabilota bacterium]|nr:hypothetical protein [Methylomirabilota bacterium]